MTSSEAPTQRRKVDLVDHQKVRARDARPALARDLVACRHVDDVDGQVGEFRAERRREIVAAAFDEHQLKVGETGIHLVDGGEIDRGVLADGRVRATACLHAHDPLRRQCAGAGEELGILARVDVVGDCRDLVGVAHQLAETVGQSGLAGADRAANSDAQRSVGDHERNSLVYWVS